ncbi:MAG: hypothetical protein ABIE92_01445, partial [bacterium]
LSHVLALGPGSLALTGAAGWGNDDHNRQSGVPESGGLLDAFIGAAYDWPVTDWLTITPAINFATILQSDIKDAYESDEIDIDPSRVYFSINAALVKP